MTREEHLEFCMKCLNRKFNETQGIVCSLTGQIAAFERECHDFKLDETVKLKVDDEFSLKRNEIKSKLSPEIFERLRQEQSLKDAIIAGFSVAIASAILWAFFTVTFEWQFGIMPILVAAGVGYGMRKIGKGIDVVFGYVGAAISLFGCLLGNFLSAIGFISIVNELSYFETLVLFQYGETFELMAATFDFKDIIFYCVAVFTGYKLSMRSITEKNIKEIRKAGS